MLESYITPLIFSYVDKYINNFQPEDSEVSLWEGDASFHNLNLKVDVLERELHLPFSLISGLIHNLLVHVPWTKLTSEPITITINTIECTLTLKDTENVNTESNKANKNQENKSGPSNNNNNHKQNGMTQSTGYVQSLINKIINNITIFCNNLILKYVEADIVISVNIKTLTLQPVNGKWETCYTDISPEMIERKLITISGMSICVDKRTAAGNIEIHQEPILNHCCLDIRLLRKYLLNVDKVLLTRLDIYCNRTEFTITELQIPMMMRIVNLFYALYERQLKVENIGSSHSLNEAIDTIGSNETWSDLAWSYASSYASYVFSSENNGNDSTYMQEQSHSEDNTIRIGVYLENTTFIFKVSECYSHGKGHYSSRKLKYWPIILLNLNGYYADIIYVGNEWFSVQMGISEILVLPQGLCTCGIDDNPDNIDIQPHFKAGSFRKAFKSESLFDPVDKQTESTRKNFLKSWDFYLSTVTESALLERTPAFAIDFLYHLDIPDDFTSVDLSKLGYDLEYSNLSEKQFIRIIFGPFTIFVTSGLIHRLSTLCEIMKSYDYSPYTNESPEPELSELLPPSTDDFEALSSFIPMNIFQITFLKPVIVFHLMDHPKFIPTKEQLIRKLKTPAEAYPTVNISQQCPSVTTECEKLDIYIEIPLYPKRLIYTTCLLPEPPESMLNACYLYIDAKITEFSSQMIFNLYKKITVILPCNMSFNYKSIFLPKYWINPEMIHEEITADIDNVIITSSKAKLLIVYHIAKKLSILDTADSKYLVYSSSLLQDAEKDSEMVILKLHCEQFKLRKIQTNYTEAHNFTVNSLKAFVIEPAKISSKTSKLNRIIQKPREVLLFSAPEFNNINLQKRRENYTLLKFVLQFSRNSKDVPPQPTILFFHVGEIKTCADLLFFQWLFYTPKYFNSKFNSNGNSESMINNSLPNIPQILNTPENSKSCSYLSSLISQISFEEQKLTITTENSYSDIMLTWIQLFSNMVISCEIAECTIFFSNKSLLAVRSQEIEETVSCYLEQHPELKIMVVKLPNFILHTAGQQYFYEGEKLPINLPSSVWSVDGSSFPLEFKIKDFSCYTLQNREKLYFVYPASGNITIGTSQIYKTNSTHNLKPETCASKEVLNKKELVKNNIPEIQNKPSTSLNKDNICSFTICINIDNTPVNITVTETQVRLITNIVSTVVEVINKINPKPTVEDKIMFKLESYITPIILSYVDKYIKNFRPEDSQVSLWGGDASFHNLDLRLDVLEQELQLPFSLISGHIHELLIHVPWTKLASEPIKITINTIECSLTLRHPQDENAESDNMTNIKENKKKQSSHNKKNETVPPPGYVQSLINKIVNNITIFCNNLILKYVEEDIVISVNIKMLALQSANEKWEACYTDISSEMIKRKLITLSDLTICLDKRNAAGKIEIYQEPILYRCCIEMRLLRQFLTNSDKALSTRLDIYCNRMEFSMTEQQIPMMMRIVNLLLALHQRQLKSETISDVSSIHTLEDEESTARTESWAGWAWSFAANIFPSEDDNTMDWKYTQQQPDSGNTFQLGVYLDNATFTFKVSEYYSSDKGYYPSRKLKYWPMICLHLNGCYVDTVTGGKEWTSVQMGISEILLLPQGPCSCGISDIIDNMDIQPYFKTGLFSENFKSESLFDLANDQTKSNRKNFFISWDYYLSTINESVLLEKTPAFAVDFLYHLEIPDDFTSENLSELGSDLEFSNLMEKSLCRIISGPFIIHITSGLIHRFSTLYEVMKSYDYSPYKEEVPEPELTELLPPSTDDFEALSTSIPIRIYQITFLKPVIIFQLMDHPQFFPNKENLTRKLKKSSGTYTISNVSLRCPSVTLECETVDTKIILPMYPKRLVSTTCQLPEPPESMLNACYTYIDTKMTGFNSQMIFNLYKKITMILPCNMCCTYKSVILPKYWINPEMIHEEITADIDTVTITSTKAKLLVVYHIAKKLSMLDTADSKYSVFSTSLLQDAAKDSGMIVLELCGEQFKWKRIQTIHTEAHNFTVSSLKAFVIEPPTLSSKASNINRPIQEQNQVLLFSAPEFNDTKTQKKCEDNTLLNAILQFSRNTESYPPQPTILFFHLEEIRACVDLLFFQWLLYTPKYFTSKFDTSINSESAIYKSRIVSDVTNSLQDTPRRTNTPHESIHGSSEKENNIHLSSPKPQISVHERKTTITSEHSYSEFILKWYQFCSDLVIFGDIAVCTIYFPNKTLSAIGSQGIRDVVLCSLHQDPKLKIVVVKFPTLVLYTAGQRQFYKSEKLPMNVPSSVWTADKNSFPWEIEIKNLRCYTLHNKKKLLWVRPASGNITIGVSLKYKNDPASTSQSEINIEKVPLEKKASKQKSISEIENKSNILLNKDNISSFNICIYINNTPVEIALSEVQVRLISCIVNAVMEVIDKINSKPFMEDKIKCKEESSSNIFRKSQNQSPTVFKEEILENISEKTPSNPPHDIKNIEENSGGIKCTVWMQWTITKFKIILYTSCIDDFSNSQSPNLISPNLKFVFDIEDIMTSLDVQDIYTKFKLKLVTASMHHYKRKTIKDKWEPGIYFGTIMRNREEIPTNEKQDDFGFMTITVTKAICGHVHNKWGAFKKYKLADMKIEQNDSNYSETRYISEIIATFQPIDFIISPRVIKNFYTIFKPLMEVNSTSYQNKNSSPEPTEMACLNNNNLPLAYLDFKGLRIVLLCSDLIEKKEIHDICIIEIESINLLPTAENPICRNPIRPDIYQQAAQSRILNIPGSEIEDRQYQFNINSLSVNTGSWTEFSQMLCRESGTALHTMNENPALEWNNLKWGRMSLIPNLNLLPIIKKFNQCIIVAPAVTCAANNLLICGCSLEINYVSDIEINITTKQFRLLCMFWLEFYTPLNTIVEEPDLQISFSYIGNIHSSSQLEIIKSEEEQYFGSAVDSGVELIDNNSESASKIKDSYTQSTTIEKDNLCLMRYNSESRSSDFSQCLKCSSLIPSAPFKQNYCPLDILITGGNISLSFYQITNQKVIDRRNIYFTSEDNLSLLYKEDIGYEEAEEEDITSSKQKVLPLLFIQISQPSIYIQDVAFEQKMNVSFFDIFVKASENSYCFIDKLPAPKDYKISLIETKTGICDPVTGIPPAFLTLKWIKNVRKSILDIDFGKPIKFNYSPEIFTHALYIKNNIYNTIQDTINLVLQKISSVEDIIRVKKPSSDVEDSYAKFEVLKTFLNDVSNTDLKISQLVLSFKTKSNYEMLLCIQKLEGNLSLLLRPERILNTIQFKNITIMSNFDNSSYLLLNPWSCTIKSFSFWESWQTYHSDPQIQITVESDCLHLDVGPQQIKCIESVIEEYNNLAKFFEYIPKHREHLQTSKMNERDQYYKDDLRAGAFQFVDATGNENELPLPYQVMFWNQTLVAMAWRYPQPRILNKVRVFPVPFKLNTNESENQQILCFLEYWSDCLNTYKTYTQFYLSESEVHQLDLPKNIPQSAISSTWRVVLSFSNSKLNSSHCISPRALAACMRIDSYFNPVLIPQIQLALNLFSFKLTLFNQFNKNLPLKMPDKLRNYTPDGLIPDNQCFLIIQTENTNIYSATWTSNLSTINAKTSISCSILDYSTLFMKPLIHPVSTEILLDLAECVNINFISEPITITFSPSVGHCVAVSSQLWTQNYQTLEKIESPDLVIVTRYIICNDTNIKLRFGQVGTDENILLPSRFLHMYCWRSQKSERRITIGIEENRWIWSKPLKIDCIKTEVIEIGLSKSYKILMTVKNISSTQKQIIFSGQLVVCNMLLDHFEMKVIPFTSENKHLDIKNAESYIVNGKTTAPSLLINMKQKMALRLRFLTLESAWSGDVPLEENNKCSQPWLVKIPLQERGQFLSIWCRIVNEKSATSQKLLVMLWPLFMIRSNLPVITKVQVETPVLNIHLETTVKGQGELQQLYCPGTIDHSHHLTFEIGTSTPSTNPYVPLNYSLIEHKEIFKKIETENIDEILEFLNKYDESSWPYSNYKLNNFEWNAEEQPLTHVQVQYQTICKYSSSLLVELVPWCLVLNTIGLPITILIEGKEVCNIQHYGVVTPPKLENTFNIGIICKEKMYISPLLQLSRDDWSQSFYMPKINGVIPLEGNITVPVKCNSAICMTSVLSNIINELRILQISASYIITNYTNINLHVICIAIPDSDVIRNLSDEVMNHYFELEPTEAENNIGVPITSWYCVDEKLDYLTDYNLHIIIATKNSKSNPIQIDLGNFRKNICLYSSSENIPLMFICQEYKGLLYLSLHHDINPQLLIKNRCSTNFCFAQSDIEGLPFPENYCINLKNYVLAETEIYYTMPSVSKRFPNLDSTLTEKLLLAVDPIDTSKSYQWSQQININIFNEHYVRVPLFGDIKLCVEQLPNTILITIDSITEEEISAQDIRSRLLLHSSEYNAQFNSAEYKKNLKSISSSKFETQFIENEDIIEKNTIIPAICMPFEDSESNSYIVVKQLKNLENLLIEYNTPKDQNWKLINLTIVLKTVIFTLTTDDVEHGFNEKDITTLTFDFVALSLEKNKGINCSIRIANIQCDNRLFHRGCFDFPVVLIGQNCIPCNIPLNPMSIKQFLQEIRFDCDVFINLRIETWIDKITKKNITEIQDVQINLGPLLIYIEDIFITKLVEYFSDLLPVNLVLWSTYNKIKTKNINFHLVEIPDDLRWETEILAKPLNLHNLVIDQISLLISVHSSVKLYIALDRSPLQFSRFERRNIRTTSYQLGHALTMHYLSGAIFGAGWVVGSLELLGSPSGLARTLGSGLRDFIRLPYHGFIQGPWAFLVGITHGSASLMRHITAGTLDSLTKLASSVARNLDRLTLDEEHQRRTEEFRRQKPQGITQGFLQGLTGLGISLLGAVGGIAHHPLQSFMNGAATPTNLVAGVGLGLVGVITKPLSGAAEFVALTGQGILQGAGWNPLPTPRLHSISEFSCAPNCILKYRWKLLQNMTSYSTIVAAAEAIFNSKSITLLITSESIIIINPDDDVIQRVINFKEINSIQESFNNFTDIKICLHQPSPVLQNAESIDSEIDQISRARVADFVRNTSNLIKLSPNVGVSSKLHLLLPDKLSPSQPSIIFYVVPQIRNYLCDILLFVKTQHDNNTFKIL